MFNLTNFISVHILTRSRKYRFPRAMVLAKFNYVDTPRTLMLCFVGQDPCLEGNHRPLADLVKRSPTYKMDSSPLCDRYITEAWYRTKYHVMSTSPTALTTCGTTYPVWLKGIFIKHSHLFCMGK